MYFFAIIILSVLHSDLKYEYLLAQLNQVFMNLLVNASHTLQDLVMNIIKETRLSIQ